MKLIWLLLLFFPMVAAAQSSDREIAADYAPVFYQALGDKPRSDYITKFDFDGDWRGDNNWRNTDNRKFRLAAYVYYSVSETQTHYFIHYAVFHPRDYKGGETKGLILSELLRQGAEAAGKRDPTGLLDEATLAHENDMEGSLVVVDKALGRTAYVQTLHHNRFSTYVPENLKMDGHRALLYIEPKGHGIEAYSDDRKEEGRRFVVYRFMGRAEEPDERSTSDVGYQLLPIESTLWVHARTAGKGVTYGASRDYSEITIKIASNRGVTDKTVKLGTIGAAFLGKQGGVNMARPPWGWFDLNRREDPPGLWFFDPAKIIKRDLKLPESFSTVYIRAPFWALK